MSHGLGHVNAEGNEKSGEVREFAGFWGMVACILQFKLGRGTFGRPGLVPTPVVRPPKKPRELKSVEYEQSY
jgi:hypothetical protein